MPLDLELLPDRPQTATKSINLDLLPDKPKEQFSLDASLLPDKPREKENWLKEGFRETSAQLQDLLTMPARLAGTPHAPMVSGFAKETVPYLLEKITTPLPLPELPPLSMRNIKSVFTGKGISELMETDTSVLDVAWYSAMIGYPAFQSIVSRQQWNTMINKLTQTERFKGTIMGNMPAIEKYMSSAGLKLPKDLPIEDKVRVVVSQAQKSPTLGDVLLGLERGKIRPKTPIVTPPVETTVQPVTTPTPAPPVTLQPPQMPQVKPPVILPQLVTPPITPEIPITPPITPMPISALEVRPTIIGKPIPPELQPLAEEAKKYKTAEEFVEVQKISAKDLVESRTKEEIQTKLQKIFGSYEELERLEEVDTPESHKILDIADKYMADLEYAANERNYGEVRTLLNNVYSEQGKVGLIKTKQQLTDIWQKAHPTPSKGEPLIEEAKKYKSAEEFVKSFKQSKQMGLTDFREVNTQFPIGEGKIYEQLLSMPEYRDARVVEKAGKGITKPITIFADKPFDLANSQIEVIDGWHRLRQAIANKDKTIPVKVMASNEQLTSLYNQVKGEGVMEKPPELRPKPPTEIGEPLKTKVIFAKKTLQVLPRKEQLLTQINESIKTAPDTNITDKTPKVTFQVDGGAEIFNTKSALTKFYDNVKKMPATMTIGVEEPKISAPKAVAAKKEEIGSLIKLPTNEYFTDGKVLIRGIPPKKAKFAEGKETKDIKQIEYLFKQPTKPAELLYYAVKEPKAHGISVTPLPSTTPEYDPIVVFHSEGKYFQYNQFRFNAIRNRFPNAEYGITENEQLIAYVNKNPVAVLLPEKPVAEIPPLSKQAQETGVYKLPTPIVPKIPSLATAGFPKFAKGIPEGTPETQAHIIEMPEIVKLAEDLGKRTPVVKRLAGKWGLFRHAKGIALDPEIFKNPNFAGSVLAHEIGHLIDWLPTETLKRGNILGRLATLHKYLAHTLADLPFTTRNEVMTELKKVTQYWNAFDDKINPKFTKYRYSSKELYAEAISVLINQPEKLQELAPKFYKSFWELIDRKPEVKEALLELQSFLMLGEGEKLRIRQEDIKSMFKKGEELFYEERNKYKVAQKSIGFKLRTELIDKNTAVLDKIKQAQKQGRIINPEDNPKYYLEEYNYIGGKIKNLLEDIDKDVLVPILKSGLTQEDLGEYLFLNRVITERADIANPLGQNRQTAEKQLNYLLQQLGEEKFNILKSAGERLQQINKQLITKAVESGLIKEETYEQIITNPAYATFQVLDYLDDYVTPAIINQVGTLKKIANPFVSTTLKMISTLRAIERNNTRKAVVNFMQDNFSNEIIPAKIRRFGRYKAEAVPMEGYGIIPTREAGKFKAYYVDPYIAQTVINQPSSTARGVISILRFFNAGYFRPVYVNLNLGFQTFNLMRDFFRAWKLNPYVNFPTMLGYYWKALPIAKQRIWGNFSDPVIKEMQQSGMLSFTYNNLMRGISEQEETQIEFLLKQYDIVKKTPSNPVVKILNVIEELGDFIETIPKVAGYLSRLKSGLSKKEIAHQVRVFSGSPDFLRKGTGYDWSNNVFLFSNAIKEGIRGDIEGAFKEPKTRSGYWWRTAKINIIPKIIALLATLGFFGQRIKENYDKQTEYDKTNYNNIPLGLSETGKAIYFRLPQDEVGRLLGGIFWKTLNLAKDKELKSVRDIGGLLGGQLPSMSPTIELVSSWSQYLLGKNPYDWFRGREILSDDERLAGGWYSLKPMLAWTAGKAGIYGLTVKAKRDDENIWEKVIRFTPIVQRFIRITDYGETEQERKELQERYKYKAIRRLEKRELR